MARGLKVKVGSFVKTNSPTTGNQAITGIGFQPKALILYSVWATANGFLTSQFSSLGFCSATEGYSVSTASEDAAAISNSERRMAAKVITNVKLDGNVYWEADLTSFDSNGFTLNWTTNISGTGVIINYIALGGEDLTNAKVVKWDTPASTGDTSITGVGFKPDCVLFAGASNVSTTLPVSDVNARLAFGAMDKDGTQWTNSFASWDSQDPADTQRSQYTNACLTQVGVSLDDNQKASFVRMGSDGFTLNFSANAIGVVPIISLCLKGGAYKVGNFQDLASASPGYQSVGGVGFNPKGMLFATATNNGVNAGITNSFGAASSALDQKATNVRDRDAVGTTSVASWQNDASFVVVDSTTNTVLSQGNLASFDSNGFTLYYPTSEAAARDILYLAFGNTIVEDATLDAGTKVKVGSFAKQAATGLQQITGLGFRPKALIMYTVAGTGGFDGTWPRASLGLTAGGGKSYSVSTAMEPGISPSNTSRRMAAKAITIVQPDATLQNEGDLASFDVDGFTLNWTTNDGTTTRLINYIAIGGIDLTDANVVPLDIVASSSSKVVTGVGFKPELVMMMGAGHTIGTTVPTSTAYALLSLGAMDKAGNQWTNYFLSADGVNPSKTVRMQRTDSVLAEASENETENRRATFTSMDVDGFTIGLPVNGPWTDRYFALCLKGSRFKVGNFTKSSTTPAPVSQSVTGVGFQPKALLFSSFASTASTSPSAYAIWGLGAASNARQNRLSSDHFETDVNGWANISGTTLLRDTSKAAKGSASLKATLSASGAYFISPSSSSPYMPRSTTMYAYLYMWVPTGKTVSVQLQDWNITGTSGGAVSVSGNNAWQLVTVPALSSPATSEYGVVIRINEATGSGLPYDIWVDMPVMYQSNTMEDRAIAIHDDDNLATTNAQGYQDNRAFVELDNGTSSLRHAADVRSLDPDGFTLDWIKTSSLASQVLYIGIGDAGIAGFIGWGIPIQ